MSSSAPPAIPARAIARFVALLDGDADVTMNAVQAAAMSKLVADQAAATEWPAEEAGATAAAEAPELIIPVPVGTADNLRAVVRYMSARVASPQREIPAPLTEALNDVVDDCDRTFLASLSDLRRDAVALASIAHYLNVAPLRDLMCAAIATMMAEMSVEQMRALLGVANDWTDQESAVLRREFRLDDLQTARAVAGAAAESAAVRL
jgi:hypothetical protein